jgi:UDP-N-acetylmuramoylalanine--D-glutamate ligase
MYKNKKFFILGMGRSGVSTAKLLAPSNHVLITDLKNEDKKEKEELESLGINVIITDSQLEIFDDSYDYLVKNPGVKLDHPVVKKARELNIPIITELEVAYHYLPKDVTIVGITGSNGKTTTTTIIYEILKRAGLSVHLAGNIGIPLAGMVDDIKPNDVLVVEISSHQLVDFHDFKTNIAVLTNLSKVHLDHFGTYDNYKQNKLNIFNHHTKQDIAILNYNDNEVVKLTNWLASKKMYFSSTSPADICIVNNFINYKGNNIIALSDVRIKGMHNYENIMAAILVAKQFNIEDRVIKNVLEDFGGVEHRIEFVDRKNGREFYNDSKATNVKSTITALKSFDNGVVLLLGGLDRGHSFDELIPYLNNTKHIICFGETKERIKEFAIKNNIDVTIVDTLEEATHLAYNISDEGDVILLSPACASWDQYKSFEERGKEFKKVVESL